MCGVANPGWSGSFTRARRGDQEMNPIVSRLISLTLSCTALCGIAAAQATDSVTGGGFINPTASGGNGSFGFVARNPTAPEGQVNYVDHGIGMHVHSTSITSYTIVDANTRQITGTCTINGVPGFTFVVTVADNGEPGRLDTFGITLSNGYIANDRLAGGNIQLHTP